MKFTVERNWVEVIGKIWLPPVTAAKRIDLSAYDIANMLDEGETPTRDNVELWLGSHTGDFQSIDDFRAIIGETEIPWKDEESEFTYHDCMYPAED